MLAVIEPHGTTGIVSYQRLDQSPAAVYIASLAPGSRRTMVDSLHVVAAMLDKNANAFTLPWGEVRFQHMAGVRARLAERFAPATANKVIAAVRGCLKAAWRLGLMTGEDYYRARDVECVKGETLPAGRYVPSGELAALMRVCEDDPTVTGIRDGAIIGTLYATGLRRAELVALDLADYDRQEKTLTVRHGKRNKARVVNLSDSVLEVLADWLDVRGTAPGALFTAMKAPRVGERLSCQGVYKALAHRASQARIRPTTPHDMRRSFVSALLDAGKDTSTIQKLTGHSDVKTLLRYDRRPDAAKKDAVAAICIPWTRRRLAMEG